MRDPIHAQLEALVDCYGIVGVLERIGAICGERSSPSGWDAWDNAAIAIAECSDSLTSERIVAADNFAELSEAE